MRHAHHHDPSENAPAVASGRGVEVQSKADSPDFDANLVGEQDKAFSTLRAQLALVGWICHIVDDGHGACAFWVSRWGQSRTLANRSQLHQFARQIGVTQ